MHRGPPTATILLAERGKVDVLGAANNIYLLDAGNGEARRVGVLDNASGSPLSEPVVVDDTLLAASGDALHAVRLPEVEQLWRFEGGSSLRPPVAAGHKVLWLSSPQNEEESTLNVLDLRTGEALWKVVLDSSGGIVVSGSTVFAQPRLGVRPGYRRASLATGCRRWPGQRWASS